jgi:hypothetical protein
MKDFGVSDMVYMADIMRCGTYVILNRLLFSNNRHSFTIRNLKLLVWFTASALRYMLKILSQY